jgi:hypothetical protein
MFGVYEAVNRKMVGAKFVEEVGEGNESILGDN